MKDKLENLPENLKNQTAKWQQYQDKDGKAGVEWEMPTTSVTITVEEHHNYGEPTWSWNNDFTASAVFTCTDDDGHTQTVPATVTDEVTTEPTCDKEGLRTYTAKVTFEGKDYTDTKTEPIPAKGHTLTAVAEVPATCETAGTSAHWKCDVCGKLFSDAEGKTETTLEKLTIPATGHAYGAPVWKWNDDFTASATFTCGNDDFPCGDGERNRHQRGDHRGHLRGRRRAHLHRQGHLRGQGVHRYQDGGHPRHQSRHGAGGCQGCHLHRGRLHRQRGLQGLRRP